MGYKTVFHILTEQLAGLKMIKSYAAEPHYADDLLKAGQTLEHQHVRMTRFNALTRMIYLTGAAISFSILFYFAVTRLEVPPANLLLLLLIFARLLPQVSEESRAVFSNYCINFLPLAMSAPCWRIAPRQLNRQTRQQCRRPGSKRLYIYKTSVFRIQVRTGRLFKASTRRYIITKQWLSQDLQVLEIHPG